jgi:hypothetical protein
LSLKGGSPMPQYKIQYERTHLFSPNINIAFSLDIAGDVTDAVLENAIDEAVRANEILYCRIVLWENGEAYYETQESPLYSIKYVTEFFEQIIYQQNRIAFDLERGEFIRFFVRRNQGGVSLFILAHHLAGDGLSMAYLADQIMRSLAGEKLAFKPVELLSSEVLPQESRLSSNLNFMLTALNQKWRSGKKIFTFEDFRRMFGKYWDGRESMIFMQQVDKFKHSRILAVSREHGVTFNTVLTTSILQAMAAAEVPGKVSFLAALLRKAASKPVEVGIAADIRQNRQDGLGNLYDAMGNFATGLSIIYPYNDGMDFWENAANVHRLIYEKLDSDARKYFLLQFLGAIDPSLVDSAYFTVFDGYRDGTAKTVAKMFGYTGHPKDVSITNLGRIPMNQTYGDFSVSNVRFVAPLVPNARRIYGIATQGDVLTVSLHVAKDENTGAEKALFEQAMENLLSHAFL